MIDYNTLYKLYKGIKPSFCIHGSANSLFTFYNEDLGLHFGVFKVTFLFYR